jgi:signal transduction histidine kinase
MKSRSSHVLLLSLLGAALLVITCNAWLALRSIQALSLAQYWVDHTWQVIHGLTQVGDSLTGAEAATQEYLLSGNLSYLDAYGRAIHALPAEISRVASLTGDNPKQQQSLAELRAAIESERNLLESKIRQRGANGEAPQIPLLLSESDLTQLDHGQLLVIQMQQTEQRLLVERVARSSQDALRAKVAAIFASFIDLVLILLAFRGITAERRLREHSDRTTERLQKLESVSDVSLTGLPAGELMQELLSRVRGLISADSLLLLVEHDGAMTVEASAGSRLGPGATIPAEKAGPLHRALVRGRVVSIPNTSAEPLSFEVFRQHIGSLLIAPLSGTSSVQGILVAGRQSTRPFENGDEEIASVAAGRIGLSLDRASAYEAERRAREQAEASAQEVRELNTELEERVAQRTAELEATNRELEAFSYSVSHDLRAPLRTIDGFSLVLDEDYRSLFDAEGRDYLNRIRQGVQRMGNLIDSLLQLSRITRAELAMEPVDLTALARTVAGELTAQNSTRVILFDIQAGLECMGDSRLLRATLENLLGNAVKFTAKRPEARIEFGRSDGAFFIRDNGAGFDPRYGHKLFNAFTRLHGDIDFRGSGIGLATVARIVQRHRGKVWAEGAEGQGATFWFRLG